MTNMNVDLLQNLLQHLSGEWTLTAITPDEVAELRCLGLVEPGGLRLTPAGHERLAELLR